MKRFLLFKTDYSARCTWTEFIVKRSWKAEKSFYMLSFRLYKSKSISIFSIYHSLFFNSKRILEIFIIRFLNSRKEQFKFFFIFFFFYVDVAIRKYQLNIFLLLKGNYFIYYIWIDKWNKYISIIYLILFCGTLIKFIFLKINNLRYLKKY